MNSEKLEKNFLFCPIYFRLGWEIGKILSGEVIPKAGWSIFLWEKREAGSISVF